MAPEQKGRGGKKPKYRIADIGGSDLTAQDTSTERVLNFLIRGEHAHADDAAADASPLPAQEPEPAAEKTAAQVTEPDAPSAETRPKKSLDHLFERASSGRAGAQARDLKLNLGDAGANPLPSSPGSEVEPVATQRVEPESPPPEVVILAPAVPPAGGTPEVTPDVTPPPSNLPGVGQVIVSEEKQGPPQAAVTAEHHAELARHAELWKGFYRLKDGEIEALKALYLMSHAEGSPECYVKMQKLAEMSNLTYRYCQKVVRSLEHLGWITKLKEYDASDQLGVLYRVNLKPFNPTS